VLDFEQVKQVPLTDVVRRYGLSLRAHRDWLNGNCPLPSHDSQTKGCFAVNVKGNYWLCHSASCQKNNGGKRGGDVIAFVARMESCSDRQAAEKLADWFNLNGNKNAPHTERRVVSEGHKMTPQKTHSENTGRSDSVKGARYMQEIDRWFDELVQHGDQESDAEYLKRVRTGVKAKLIESYRNGKRAAEGLRAESA